MADEVIVTYGKAASITNGIASGVFGEVLGSYVLDIATASSAIGGEVCRVQSKGTGFWLKLGTSGVSAAADTDGNIWIPANGSFDFEVTSNQNYLDTAADA